MQIVTKDNWVAKLECEFPCEYVVFEPFPSAAPELFEGYRIKCNLRGDECDHCSLEPKLNVEGGRPAKA